MVLHNQNLAQVTREMRGMEGDPRYDASQDIPAFPYGQYAELVGLRGLRVDSPINSATPGSRRCQSTGPSSSKSSRTRTCPPIPPHIELSQVKAYTTSILHGDTNRVDMVKQVIKGKLADFTS